MKFIAVLAMLLCSSLVSATALFKCDVDNGDIVYIDKVSSGVLVITPRWRDLATKYNPGKPIISIVVGSERKLQFDRISGLGVMRSDNEFLSIDCTRL